MPSVKGLFKKLRKKKKKKRQQQQNDQEKTNALAISELKATDLLVDIATINETSSSKRPALLIHKLRLCCIRFDWTDAKSDREAKEKKRLQLMELVELVGKGRSLFTKEVLKNVITMLQVNLFRPLPPPIPEEDLEDEDDPVFEPSWPHLQIVYEFFLRFIVSSDIDVKHLTPLISESFIRNVVALFDSQDHRERDYLKTILHRIYAKFMSMRAFIRATMNNSFYTFMYQNGKLNGVAELLEILGSIINGFAHPLKQEHKNFLNNVLVPLHKVDDITYFHPQLSYCVTQFVDKDPNLAIPVISGLLRYWPHVSSSKELLFVNELEELLELTQPDEFAVLAPSLCRRLRLCVGSNHFQIAERSLFLWHNEYISGLILNHRQQVLPIIYPALHGNQHWNPTVNNLTENVLKIFEDQDPTLVEQCRQFHEKALKEHEAHRQTLVQAWQAVSMRAARNI